MENKFIPCEIKFKVLEDEKPDFGKFIASKDMQTIFYLREKFRDKKTKFGELELYDFSVENELIKAKTSRIRYLGENFDDFLVVEPYVVDEKGNFLADYKNFYVMHAQTTGNFIVKLPCYPEENPCGMLLFESYRYCAVVDSRGLYRLNYIAATMEMDMREFWFTKANIDAINYKESYIKKLEREKEQAEKELYLKLKEKFEKNG
jgi:predicted nucleotidyltransferase component of viral defense system